MKPLPPPLRDVRIVSYSVDVEFTRNHLLVLKHFRPNWLLFRQDLFMSTDVDCPSLFFRLTKILVNSLTWSVIGSGVFLLWPGSLMLCSMSIYKDVVSWHHSTVTYTWITYSLTCLFHILYKFISTRPRVRLTIPQPHPPVFRYSLSPFSRSTFRMCLRSDASNREVRHASGLCVLLLLVLLETQKLSGRTCETYYSTSHLCKSVIRFVGDPSKDVVVPTAYYVFPIRTCPCRLISPSLPKPSTKSPTQLFFLNRFW